MYIWKKATAEALKEIAKTLKVNKSCRHDIDGGRAKLGLGSSYPRKWENEKKKGLLSKGVVDVHVNLAGRRVNLYSKRCVFSRSFFFSFWFCFICVSPHWYILEKIVEFLSGGNWQC
jgi:hypothetical protein